MSVSQTPVFCLSRQHFLDIISARDSKAVFVGSSLGSCIHLNSYCITIVLNTAIAALLHLTVTSLENEQGHFYCILIILDYGILF